MDLDFTPTPTKSAEETELDDTPPHDQPQSVKSHRPPPPLYKECMKNHAAAIGGHAVDGCGEYMPPSSTVLAIPTSLLCAACGCHRNFHRRDPEFPTPAITPPFLDFRRPGPPTRTSSLSPPRPPLRYAPQALLALSTAVAAEEHHQQPVTPTGENPVSRKRHRTRFSNEQKEKMHAFAEKLGWKMHKSNDAEVEEFCREVGVLKDTLKVWMHNNKNAAGRRETGGGVERNTNGDGDGDGDGEGEGEQIRRSEDDDDGGDSDQNEGGGKVRFHDSNNNGSCSSA